MSLILKEYRVLSGANVEQALLNEKSSYLKLYRKIKQGFPATKARQNLSNTVTVQTAKYTPYPSNSTLQVDLNTITSSGSQYQQRIILPDVVFEGTTKIPGTEDKTMTPARLTSVYVQVNCTCLDFYWRFATWNAGDESLAGNPPPPYKKKTRRPPVNPRKVPGVCKHLIACFNYLKRNKIVA